MLKVISLDEAKKIISGLPEKPLRAETADIAEALTRTAAEDIRSRETVPPFDRSTVDGFAVRAQDTFGSSESIPAMLDIAGEIGMGEETRVSLRAGQCAKIATGGMLPPGADAAIMVENTSVTPDGLCLCFSPVSPYSNVTRAGDDTKPGDTLVRKGDIITPRHTGALAAAGISAVPVVKKPVVTVISTGSELTEITEKSAPGKIRDVNSYLISALCRSLGCEVITAGIIPDETQLITAALSKAAAESDAVLISGGSSAGDKDEARSIISSLGEVYAHGIAMKPGKPTVIGKIGSAPVIGLPGHPAAAYFVASSLLRALLPQMGVTPPPERTGEFPAACNIGSNHGREEFVCVGIEGGAAEPHPAKSGIISMLSKSDGYITIDRNTEGIKKGETVTVRFFG